MVYKRNMFQKAVSLLLTVSLFVSGIGVTARAEAPVEPIETPQLRVVGTLTDGGKYLELGLSIDGKAASFQSAGVLLKYDTTKLTPLKWGTIEDESGVLADAKINVPAATATNAAWKEASILPTKSKGADDLVGKTAKAVKLSESATSAYLYLSAEAPKGQLLNQLLPEEKGAAPTGLPPATANGKTITAIGAAEAPADQVVTVRFLVGTTTDATEGAVERNYTLAELVAAIDLVVYDSATPNADELKLLQGSPLAIPGGTPTKLEGLSYIADNTDYTTAGFTTAADVSFVWVAAGQTVDSGGGGKADPSSCASIVFYDWDEATILGSIVVVKGQDATEQVNEFVMSLMSPESRDFTKWAGAEDSAKPYFVDDTNYLLTNKKGYSFYDWVPYNSADYQFTHCGDAMDGNNKQVYIEPPRREENVSKDGNLTAEETLPRQTQDFSNVSGSIIVKACYLSNSDLTFTPTQAANMFYNEAYSGYNRIGSSTNYSVTVEVRRVSVEGKAVPRLVEPMLKVTSILSTGGSLVAFYSLENQDVATYTFYPSTGILTVQCVVVDFYQVTNKGAVSNKTSTATEKQGTGAGMDGFLWKGTVGLIGDAIATNTTTVMTKPVLQTQGNLPLDASGVTAANAQKYLRSAWVIRNSTSGTEDTLRPEEERINLSYEEMVFAIQNNGAWSGA